MSQLTNGTNTNVSSWVWLRTYAWGRERHRCGRPVSKEYSSSTHPWAHTCSRLRSSARGRWTSTPCGVQDVRSTEWSLSTGWRIPPCRPPSSARPMDSRITCKDKTRKIWRPSANIQCSHPPTQTQQCSTITITSTFWTENWDTRYFCPEKR